MKVLHLNAGNETGGGMHHILHLLKQFTHVKSADIYLGLFEKKKLYHLAEKENIKTVYFPNKTRLSVPLLKRLIHFIKEEEITIVHTHGPRANVYINAIRNRIPFHWITTVHSHPEHDFKAQGLYGKLLYQLHLNAIKNADRIITVCDAFHPLLTDSRVQKRKITTVLNGINFSKQIKAAAIDREDLGYSVNDFLFLQVARLEEVKGHHLTLVAFAQLIEHAKHAYLLVVGDGPLRKQLFSLAVSLGVQDNVRFFGEQENVELFYQLADVTLLSSLSEGFPLVLLESARAKKTVISSNVGGVNQLIINKNVGWKVKPNCTEELLYAMREAYLSKRDGRLKLMGERLHHHASTRFSLEKFAENVYNVYLSSVSGN